MRAPTVESTTLLFDELPSPKHQLQFKKSKTLFDSDGKPLSLDVVHQEAFNNIFKKYKFSEIESGFYNVIEIPTTQFHRL